MLTVLKKTMDKVLKEIKRMLYEQIKSTNKKIEITKKKKMNQIGIWELTIKISEMKNSLDGFRSTSERVEKQPVNLKIGQLKLFRLKNREKKE